MKRTIIDASQLELNDKVVAIRKEDPRKPEVPSWS